MMTEDERDLFRNTFMSPELAWRYAWRSRRRPGTRLERAERIWAAIGGHLAPPPHGCWRRCE